MELSSLSLLVVYLSRGGLVGLWEGYWRLFAHELHPPPIVLPPPRNQDGCSSSCLRAAASEADGVSLVSLAWLVLVLVLVSGSGVLVWAAGELPFAVSFRKFSSDAVSISPALALAMVARV